MILEAWKRYAAWFPFQYKEFEINVDQCFLALDHYNCRQMEEKQINSCMLFFAKSANRPAACAYLMPVNNCSPKKGVPMMLNEVKEEKIQEYKYWIIDSQHSIYAAK